MSNIRNSDHNSTSHMETNGIGGTGYWVPTKGYRGQFKCNDEHKYKHCWFTVIANMAFGIKVQFDDGRILNINRQNVHRPEIRGELR